jgi:hypothetical protein
VGQKLVSKSLSPKIIIDGVLLKVFTTVAGTHHAEGRVDPVDLALKNRNWF